MLSQKILIILLRRHQILHNKKIRQTTYLSKLTLINLNLRNLYLFNFYMRVILMLLVVYSCNSDVNLPKQKAFFAPNLESPTYKNSDLDCNYTLLINTKSSSFRVLPIRDFNLLSNSLLFGFAIF